MQKTQIRFTYRDYVLLPEQDRRELIDGDFHMVPAPKPKHQRSLANLAFRLEGHARRNRLGTVFLSPLDVILSDDNVVQPDILFVSAERNEIITEDNIQGAPDMVVEVLSPSTADRDRQLKLGLYARFGVREYWIVDTVEESVQVLELSPEGYESSRTYTAGVVPSRVVAGFEIDLTRIFAE